MGDEDKQFDATPQKLERARKEGQVVKSKDVSIALSLLVMFTFINMLAPVMWKLIVGLFRTLYEQIPNQHLSTIGYPYMLIVSLIPAVAIIGSILNNRHHKMCWRDIMKQNTKDYKITFHYLPTQINLKKVLESNYLNYLKKQENDSTKRKGHLYNDR